MMLSNNICLVMRKTVKWKDTVKKWNSWFVGMNFCLELFGLLTYIFVLLVLSMWDEEVKIMGHSSC